MALHSGEQGFICSFCGKTRAQANKLIQGPDGVFICDECIAECCDILSKSEQNYSDKPNARLTAQEDLSLIHI